MGGGDESVRRSSWAGPPGTWGFMAGNTVNTFCARIQHGAKPHPTSYLLGTCGCDPDLYRVRITVCATNTGKLRGHDQSQLPGLTRDVGPGTPIEHRRHNPVSVLRACELVLRLGVYL